MTPSPWRNERNTIDCCHKCKPPKRYPGCGDHCPEYKAAKAKHAEEKKREREYLETHRTISNYDFNKVQRKHR